VIRVLVVDDSAVVRTTLTEQLQRFDDIEVVGSAADPYIARDKIVTLNPDVVTLDLEMPRMDGLTFLDRVMRHHPLPVVVVSSLTPRHSEAAVRALSLGAVDVVCKPGSTYSVPQVGEHLVHAVRNAARAGVAIRRGALVSRETTASPPPLAAIEATNKIIAIGASTGGTRALETVLSRMPAGAPGMVVVQHMSAGFTEAFANRLSQNCRLDVREARDGDAITSGVVLIAPAGKHMLVQASGANLVARTKLGPPVHHQRPAVDVLFESVARATGRNAVGAVLTGMGADGAKGLLAMRNVGAHTIAQDEATSVVFGMPKEAIALGAAHEVLPLGEIAAACLRAAATRTAAR
jgi:two-component system chemotaxis response regulator CheB